MEKRLGKRKVGESSRPKIVYPQPPIEPFKSTPIIEIPNTLKRPQFYSVEDFEEENNKLYAMHVELNNQYEETIRQGVLYLIDRIEWPAFFYQLARIRNQR